MAAIKDHDPETRLKTIRSINERMFFAIVDNASAGNHQYLESLGIDHESAELLGNIQARAVNTLISRSRSCLFELRVRPEFRHLLQNLTNTQTREQVLAKLLGLGATQVMLTDLGFAMTRDEYSQRQSNFRSVPRGRPRSLSETEERNCNAFWRLLEKPFLIDPIYTLIETSEKLDIRIAAIWQYIGPYGPRSEQSLRDCSLDTDPWNRPWVQIMFPDQAEKERTKHRNF